MYFGRKYSRGFILISGLVILFLVSMTCSSLLLLSQKTAESKLFTAKTVKKVNTSSQLEAICEKVLLDVISPDKNTDFKNFETVTNIGENLPSEIGDKIKAHIIYAGAKSSDIGLITEYGGVAVNDHEVIYSGRTGTARHFFVRTECADSVNNDFVRVTVREYVVLTDKYSGAVSLVPLYAVNKMFNKDK